MVRKLSVFVFVLYDYSVFWQVMSEYIMTQIKNAHNSFMFLPFSLIIDNFTH